MKTIGVVIPCYNEVENVEPMARAILDLFRGELSRYRLELLFIDNHSTDGTREILRELCAKEENVRAIFNARNVGPFNSTHHGLLQASGDAVVLLACDFQEPVELIPEFVRRWEEGAQIVAGARSNSQQNPIVYAMRTLYYKLMRTGSDIRHIDHFTGFGLYDRSFLEELKKIDDPAPFLRGMVAELGSRIEIVNYVQPKRKRGKTHNGFWTLYDGAMVSFTTYTTMGLRWMTVIGFGIALVSFVIGLVYLIRKLTHWYTFNAGMAPVLIGMFFLGSIVLLSLGLMGEYLISINRRLMRRPLVVEEERIGFSEEENKEHKEDLQEESGEK